MEGIDSFYTPEDKELLVAMAKRAGRSISGQIRFWVLPHLEEERFQVAREKRKEQR